MPSCRPPRAALSVLLVALVAGPAGARQQDLPSAPGVLVDVGGRRLHLLCSGQGTPAVILEAGASAFAIDWTLVQRELATTNRVCSYDRAGMGWSDSAATGARPNEPADLYQLLRTAREPGPHVLVGASRGGLLVRQFTADHPDQVAGLVLVDPASEDRLFTILKGEGVLIASLTPEQIRMQLPPRTVNVPRRAVQTGPPFDRLPAELYQLRQQLDARLIASTPAQMTPEMIGVFQEQERHLLAGLLAARKADPHPLGSRPTVVLSRGDEPNPEREAVHAALARLSSNSRHAVVAGAGHEIHLFQPAAVIQAVRDVITAIRNGKPLPPAADA